MRVPTSDRRLEKMAGANTSQEPKAGSAAQPGAAPAATGLATWAKLFVVVSVLLMAAGIAAPLLSQSNTGPRTLAMGNPMGADADGNSLPDYSPAIFRLGFSFFAAFAMAYALRAFFRLAIIFIGMAFLMLFGLQYAGLIEVKWGVMAREYDGIAAWLQGQTQTFFAFVTGYLPSAAAATAGFVAGFRRR